MAWHGVPCRGVGISVGVGVGVGVVVVVGVGVAWRRRRRHTSRDLISKNVAETPVVLQAGGEENIMEDCRAGRRCSEDEK